MVGDFSLTPLSGTGLPLPDGPSFETEVRAAVRWDPDGSFDHSFGGSGFVPVARAEVALLTADDHLLGFDAGGGKLTAERRVYGAPDPSGVTLGAGGLLGVDGTAKADAIAVTRAGANVRVSVRGGVRTFAASKVKAVFVDGGHGDDAVTVAVPGVSARVSGGAGKDTLTGGSLVYGGTGDDRAVKDNFEATSSVERIG